MNEYYFRSIIFLLISILFISFYVHQNFGSIMSKISKILQKDISDTFGSKHPSRPPPPVPSHNLPSFGKVSHHPSSNLVSHTSSKSSTQSNIHNSPPKKFVSGAKDVTILKYSETPVSSSSVDFIKLKYLGNIKVGYVGYYCSFEAELILPENIQCIISNPYYDRYHREIMIDCKKTSSDPGSLRRYKVTIGQGWSIYRGTLKYGSLKKTLNRSYR